MGLRVIVSCPRSTVACKDGFGTPSSQVHDISLRSEYRSAKRAKCWRTMRVYLTNSSAQSTMRSRFEPGFMRNTPSWSSDSSKRVYACGTDDWFGIANMRIQRPSIRRLFTLLKDCEPPETIASPRVRPWVGRTEPVLKGIQSI